MARLLLSLTLIIAAIVPLSLHGRDQEPVDIVRGIYGWFSNPQAQGVRSIDDMRALHNRRDAFTAPLVAFFDADDSYGEDHFNACLDFGLPINGQDFDANEIARTLTVSSSQQQDRDVVDARFTNFGETNHIRYTFEREDGQWKIADIASLARPVWRLSEIPCKPAGGPLLQNEETVRFAQERLSRLGYDPGPIDGRFGRRSATAIAAFQQDRHLPVTARLDDHTVAALASTYDRSMIGSAQSQGTAASRADQPGAGRMCYVNAMSTLDMTIDASGSADFAIDSVQAGLHMCAIAGAASRIADGWRYAERMSDGARCTLDIVLSDDGSVALRDPDWICKQWLCGHRAAFEHITFHPSHRRDC